MSTIPNEALLYSSTAPIPFLTPSSAVAIVSAIITIISVCIAYKTYKNSVTNRRPWLALDDTNKIIDADGNISLVFKNIGLNPTNNLHANIKVLYYHKTKKELKLPFNCEFDTANPITPESTFTYKINLNTRREWARVIFVIQFSNYIDMISGQEYTQPKYFYECETLPKNELEKFGKHTSIESAKKIDDYLKNLENNDKQSN